GYGEDGGRERPGGEYGPGAGQGPGVAGGTVEGDGDQAVPGPEGQRVRDDGRGVAAVVDEQRDRLQDHDAGGHGGGAVPDDDADGGADQGRERGQQGRGHDDAQRA